MWSSETCESGENESEGRTMEKIEKHVRIQAWDVILRGKVIDTLFCDPKMTAWEVKDGLVNHDGYNPEIKVKKS